MAGHPGTAPLSPPCVGNHLGSGKASKGKFILRKERFANVARSRGGKRNETEAEKQEMRAKGRILARKKPSSTFRVAVFQTLLEALCALFMKTKATHCQVVFHASCLLLDVRIRQGGAAQTMIPPRVAMESWGFCSSHYRANETSSRRVSRT